MVADDLFLDVKTQSDARPTRNARFHFQEAYASVAWRK